MPGIIGMVILFSTMLSALGSVHDRQFGPMRILMIAPVPRGVIVIGKTISSALIGAAFAVVLSPLAWLFHVDMSFLSYLGFVGAVVLCSLSLSALGMLAASCIRHLEDFAVAINFVIFPMFFFSGALYPADSLPGYMQPIARINPLTYGVDLIRQTMLAGESRTLSPAQFAPRIRRGRHARLRDRSSRSGHAALRQRQTPRSDVPLRDATASPDDQSPGTPVDTASPQWPGASSGSDRAARSEVWPTPLTRMRFERYPRRSSSGPDGQVPR